MVVVLGGKTFVAALIEMPDADRAVRGVVSLGVRKRDPSHIVGQIAIFPRPEQQMPVLCEAPDYVESRSPLF